MTRPARVPVAPLKARARIWTGAIPGTHEPGFREAPIVQYETPELIRQMAHGDDLELKLYAFRMGECNVLLGHEPANGGPLRWHLTISCPDRHPTWDEVKTAKYRLTGPDVPMAMFLPPASEYVNERQDHVFQLWELLDGEARDAWTVGGGA